MVILIVTSIISKNAPLSLNIYLLYPWYESTSGTEEKEQYGFEHAVSAADWLSAFLNQITQIWGYLPS